MTGSRERYLADLECVEVVKGWKLPLPRKTPKPPVKSWTKPVSRADEMADRAYREMREQARNQPQRRGIQKGVLLPKVALTQPGLKANRIRTVGDLTVRNGGVHQKHPGHVAIIHNTRQRDQAGANRYRVQTHEDAEMQGLRYQHVGKRDNRPQRPPLPKTLTTKESGLLVARHGLTGTLPSHLNREERMKVYEARYHAAGGPKGEKYARRAQASDRVKVGALGTATAAGAGILAARTRKGAKLLGGLKHAEKIKSHSETAGLAAATVGGASELYGDAARRKQASYTSTPAGVAASALRRLHAYPGGPK